MHAGSRRERSRSPHRGDKVGRRRDGKSQDLNGGSGSKTSELTMNPMVMANLYSQGNMLMAGNMYSNMMMPGTMMSSGIIPTTGMEIMQGSGMDVVSQTPMDISAIGGQAIATNGGTMDMSMMGGMIMDPSMMAMYSSISTDIPAVHEKKEIVFKHCKLIPPDSGIPQPPRRSRPPGCRTIFVGAALFVNLSDKTRETIVREIFEPYGRIHTLRISKKNFCHIRFDREECVDAAMLISGYQIKLINSNDDESDDDDKSHTNISWLHVDYALSRDDQNDYERKQRQAMRVHQQQLNAQQEIASHSMSSYERSPSPVRAQPFNSAAMIQLIEKIKNEEQFPGALPTLIAWLERGECSKKNANQFYSMIQTTNSHIRRLFNEKIQYEEEFQDCKERVKNQIATVIEQLEQVAKVFVAASHQRIWDHFTKPQRKNIETWQKMTQEFKTLKEEFHEKFFNDEGDFNINKGSESNSNEVLELKRENESLRFQLEAYKNEVDVIKMDAQKEMEKFKAQFIARQALQEAMGKNPPLPSPVSKPPPPPPLPDDSNPKLHLEGTIEPGCGEAKLIGIMSAFLQVHPQGASLDYVVSYVRALFPQISQATVYHVLQKHTDVFSRSTTGVGANIEHRWSFIAFNKIDESNQEC